MVCDFVVVECLCMLVVLFKPCSFGLCRLCLIVWLCLSCFRVGILLGFALGLLWVVKPTLDFACFEGWFGGCFVVCDIVICVLESLLLVYPQRYVLVWCFSFLVLIWGGTLLFCCDMTRLLIWV